MHAHEQIGFIGLGNMGGPIALRLLRSGYLMTVLDLALTGLWSLYVAI